MKCVHSQWYFYCDKKFNFPPDVGIRANDTDVGRPSMILNQLFKYFRSFTL